MHEVRARVISNRALAPDIYDLCLRAEEIAAEAKPGQFVMVRVDQGGHLLSRPISICEVSRETGLLRLVYQVVGAGTAWMAGLGSGEGSGMVQLFGPLGNGFPLPQGGETRVALVGGGIGVPPLLELCKTLLLGNPSLEVTAFLGYRTTPVLQKDFELVGAEAYVATDDGSSGFHGTVLGQMEALGYVCDTAYACGPKPMLRALAQWAEDKNIPAWLSLEERMACGFGACVGCAVPIRTKGAEGGWEYRKVCKDGSVFDRREVAWDVY